MSLEQVLTNAALIAVIVAWVVSKRGTATRFVLGVVIVAAAIHLYASDRGFLGDVWRAVVALPDYAFGWLRDVRG